ncbi:MAG: N-acetyltransferase [Rhodanobacter sp.]
MFPDIQHDEVAQRFKTTVDGATCVLDYIASGGLMTITHTGVPGRVGGRGVAAALVQAALDAARGCGWKVRPACSYAAVWMQRHPEYLDLQA